MPTAESAIDASQRGLRDITRGLGLTSVELVTHRHA
jgi:hypothetical protein